MTEIEAFCPFCRGNYAHLQQTFDEWGGQFASSSGKALFEFTPESQWKTVLRFC